MLKRVWMAAWTGVTLASLPALAVEASGPPPPKDSPVMAIPPLPPSAGQWKIESKASRAPIAPRRYVVERSGVFDGRKMHYSVTAEDIVISDANGTPKGSIFSFTYKSPAPAGAQRPVVFIFNGGPGSASTWLHMGVIGPRRADFTDVNPSQVPPFHVVDNPNSLISEADLVFIDPIGTGFSRYWGEGRPEDFYGAEEDAASVARFIQSWLRRHHRWNSPKFLLGESYGTYRANMLSRRLMGGVLDGTLKGISLNGVILVGGDGGLARPEGNDKFLPTFTTMAATAWYHARADRQGREFDSFIAQAERFARDELVPALNRWDSLTDTQKAQLAVKHAGFTGLSVDYLLSKGLRIMPSDFGSALLADQGKTIGHYDSRYVLPTAGSLGDPVADDGAMGQYSAAFIGAFNNYIRDDLGIDIDDDYVNIDFLNVNFPWRNPPYAPGVPAPGSDPGADIAAAMRRNPDLQLMTIEGWFDLFGAVGSAKFGVAQRQLPQDRVIAKAYWSGHMAYVGQAGVQMAKDLREFIRTASKGRQK
ncbi:S10 family peptidase [Sphingobium sp. AP50]|uniref:S10 family peptidase n=1 Tax=Sphingobium sp. AP50 TaxID=1884369 RepID=UPI0015A635D9|nr:peptidase S10 [Sphingobium sp. AP50]